jgi:hypothetical protein
MHVLTKLFVAGVISSPFSAAAETIRCKMDRTPAPYYIAPEVWLDVGEFGKVTVEDAIVVSTDRDRVFGEIAKDDSKRLSITWEVKDVPPNPAETRAYGSHLLVRLTIQRADSSARMTIVDARSRRYEYRTTGTCRMTE